MIRKMKIDESELNMKIIKCFSSIGLILISQGNNELILIDYEYLKIPIAIILDIEGDILDVNVIEELFLILIYTSTGELFLIRNSYDPLVTGISLKLELLQVLKFSQGDKSITSSIVDCSKSQTDPLKELNGQ